MAPFRGANLKVRLRVPLAVRRFYQEQKIRLRFCRVGIRKRITRRKQDRQERGIYQNPLFTVLPPEIFPEYESPPEQNADVDSGNDPHDALANSPDHNFDHVSAHAPNSDINNDSNSDPDGNRANKAGLQIIPAVRKLFHEQIRRLPSRMSPQVPNQVSPQVSNQVSPQVSNQVSPQVSNQEPNQVSPQVSNQVIEQMPHRVLTWMLGVSVRMRSLLSARRRSSCADASVGGVPNATTVASNAATVALNAATVGGVLNATTVASNATTVAGVPNAATVASASNATTVAGVPNATTVASASNATTVASLLLALLLLILPAYYFNTFRQPYPVYILIALAFAVVAFCKISGGEMRLLWSPLDKAVFLLPGLAVISSIGAWNTSEAINLALLLSSCAALYWTVSSIVNNLAALRRFLAVIIAGTTAVAPFCITRIFQEGASFPSAAALGAISITALLFALYLRTAIPRAVGQERTADYPDDPVDDPSNSRNRSAYPSDPATPYGNYGTYGTNSTGRNEAPCDSKAAALLHRAKAALALGKYRTARAARVARTARVAPVAGIIRIAHQQEWHNIILSAASYLLLLVLIGLSSVLNYMMLAIGIPLILWKTQTAERKKSLVHILACAAAASLVAGRVRFCMISGNITVGWLWVALGFLLVITLECTAVLSAGYLKKTGRRMRSWVRPGATLLLALLLLYSGTNYLRSTLNPTGQPVSYYAQYYMEEKLFKGLDALRIMTSSPRILLQGTGGGGWEPLAYQHQSFYYQDAPPGAFAQTGVEMGLPGLVALLATWFLYFREMAKQRSPGRLRRPLKWMNTEYQGSSRRIYRSPLRINMEDGKSSELFHRSPSINSYAQNATHQEQRSQSDRAAGGDGGSLDRAAGGDAASPSSVAGGNYAVPDRAAGGDVASPSSAAGGDATSLDKAADDDTALSDRAAQLSRGLSVGTKQQASSLHKTLQLKEAAWAILTPTLLVGIYTLVECTISTAALTLLLFTLFGLGMALGRFSGVEQSPGVGKKLLQFFAVSAIVLLVTLISLNSFAAENHALQAAHAIKQGDINTAEMHYQQAVHRAPLNAEYRKELGKIYLMNEQLNGQPVQPAQSASINAARIYNGTSRTQIPGINSMIPSTSSTHMGANGAQTRSLVSVSNGFGPADNTVSARKNFQNISLGEHCSSGHAQASSQYTNKDTLYLACEQFKQGIRLARGDAELRTLYASALIQTGQPEEGVWQLETAVLLRPLQQDLYENLALGYVTAARMSTSIAIRGTIGGRDPVIAEKAQLYLSRTLAIPQLLEERAAQIDKRHLRHWSGAPYLGVTPKIQLYCGQAAAMLGDKQTARYYLEQAVQDASLKTEAELWQSRL